jgi:uncharacterized protein (DUF1501 family)
MNDSMHHRSRRSFLKAAAGTAACGSISSLAPQLSMLGTALAQSSITGYKALVCLYLGGGSDSFNLLIPTDPDRHNEYLISRGGTLADIDAGIYRGNPQSLGIPRPGGSQPAGALPPALPIAGGTHGLNPACPELRDLYDQGRLTFMCNVGPLVDPVTRATFNTRVRPPQLYSHSDQTSLWEIGDSLDSAERTGWGGMLAGWVGAQSSLAGLPPCITIANQTRFLVGRTQGSPPQPILPYRLSTSATSPAPTLGNYGATTTGNLENIRRANLDALLAQTYPQVFSNEFGDLTERSLNLGAAINQRIGTGGAFNQIPVGVTFPNTNIGNQLAQVFRMVNASRAGGGGINANRQIYYVNTGGYDTHDGQFAGAGGGPANGPNPQTGAWGGQQGLLQQVSQAVAAFYRALVAIGAHNEVLLFSASEFGRTINSNGNGTDHGWGGIQFVVGGGQGTPTDAVGGQPIGANDVGGGPLLGRNPQAGTGTGLYGRYPRIVLNASDSAAIPAAEKGECFSRGQFLPTMSTEQMSASMARWMGLDAANVPFVFPNVDRYDDFAGSNLMAYTGRTVPFIAGI